MKSPDNRPSIRIPEHVQVPLAERHDLPGGARLYALDCSDQGVARVSFVFEAGTARQRYPFTAAATVGLLSEGSERLTARQIAERLDFYGSYFEVNIDRDYAIVSFNTLSRYMPQTLAVAEEILLHPVFPEREVEGYRTRRRQALELERTKVDYRAREQFGKVLFGNEHPYGVTYPSESYDRLSRGDILAFYRSRYVGPACFAVASGDLDADVVRRIADLVTQLPVGEVAPFDPPAPDGQRRGWVEMPGAVQSAVRVGRVLFPRTHPDFIGMQVLATVLGGYFGSRLVRNLREEHGYTYGVFAAMINLDRAGYLAIGTEVAAAATRDSLAQIAREMSRLCEEPVGEEELRLVRSVLIGEVMRVLDGPFGIADVTIENVQNGTDNGYVDRFVQEVRAITPDRIHELACRYLRPEEISWTVAGAENPFG